MSTSCVSTRLWLAIMSQAGVAAPTVDFLIRNDLGEVLTFTYSAPGQYVINSPGSLFLAGKVTLLGQVGNGDGIVHGVRITNATHELHTNALPGGVHTDGVLQVGTIRIEIAI